MTYLWVENRIKPINVDFFTNKLQTRKKRLRLGNATNLFCLFKWHPSHLCHLDHIGELCEAGNRDDIVVGS